MRRAESEIVAGEVGEHLARDPPYHSDPEDGRVAIADLGDVLGASARVVREVLDEATMSCAFMRGASPRWKRQVDAEADSL